MTSWKGLWIKSFPSLSLGWTTLTRKLSSPYYFPVAGLRSGFIPFPRVGKWGGIQTVLDGIWNLFINFIFCIDNNDIMHCCITCTSQYVCMYVNTYLSIYISIYIHIYLYIYAYVCIYICLCIYMCVCVCVCVSLKHTHENICVYVSMSIKYRNEYMYAHVYVCL